MAMYDASLVDQQFSTNFRLLRSFYSLTTRDLAGLLHYKSPSNIAYFEKLPLSNRPSYQVLVSLQQLYGISFDWLLGCSFAPFTEDTLKVAESMLESRLNSLSLDFTDEKFKVEQKLQGLLLDFLSSNYFSQFTLNDQFVCLFLINFLDEGLCKAYAAIEVNREKTYSKFRVVRDGKVIITKYPDFIPMLELFCKEKNRDHNTSVLGQCWDFMTYIQSTREDR